MPRRLAVLAVTLAASACGARTGLPTMDVEDDARSDADTDASIDTGREDTFAFDSTLPDVALVDTATVCPEGSVDAGSPLANLQQGMVGHWVGVATPLDWARPYRVDIVFRADGRYSARCLDSGCVAFYYGIDTDSPSKRYEIYDIKASGEGFGRINIVFGPGGGFQQGALERIYLLDGGDRLTFEFFRTWGGRYGPVSFDLRRSCP